MADEQAKATLTQIRGKQAAAMPHDEAKEYVKGSAKMDKDYAGTAEETAGVSRKQQAQQVLGSFKQGGTVPKTGVYKLHKGEQVVATPSNPSQGTAQSSLREKASILRKSGDTSGKAADFESRASSMDVQSGYTSHGPNGNMVRRGSSAIAAHDKDK